jgi:endothelin-converting enzyme
VWCASVRPSEAHKHILSDPHAPHRARVNAVVQNTPAFAKAFGCPAGAPMNPLHKCEVWL